MGGEEREEGRRRFGRLEDGGGGGGGIHDIVFGREKKKGKDRGGKNKYIINNK